MALTLEERLSIEAHLEQLYEAVPPDAASDCGQVREYIDAGEYGLALDDLADIYLEFKRPVPQNILSLFEELATRMGMRPGGEWRAVAEILTHK